eukprot:751851-Hanusia_phi.AAC.1
MDQRKQLIQLTISEPGAVNCTQGMLKVVAIGPSMGCLIRVLGFYESEAVYDMCPDKGHMYLESDGPYPIFGSIRHRELPHPYPSSY